MSVAQWACVCNKLKDSITKRKGEMETAHLRVLSLPFSLSLFLSPYIYINTPNQDLASEMKQGF